MELIKDSRETQCLKACEGIRNPDEIPNLLEKIKDVILDPTFVSVSELRKALEKLEVQK